MPSRNTRNSKKASFFDFVRSVFRKTPTPFERLPTIVAEETFRNIQHYDSLLVEYYKAFLQAKNQQQREIIAKKIMQIFEILMKLTESKAKMSSKDELKLLTSLNFPFLVFMLLEDAKAVRFSRQGKINELAKFVANNSLYYKTLKEFYDLMRREHIITLSTEEEFEDRLIEMRKRQK